MQHSLVNRSRNSMQTFINNLLYGGINKESLEDIKESIRSHNHKSALTFSLVSAVYLLLMACLQFSKTHSIHGLCALYTFYMVIFFIIALSLWIIPKYSQESIMPLTYLFMICVYIALIRISMTRPSQLAISFVIVLVALPTLISDVPIRLMTLILGASLAYIITAFIFKDSQIASEDFWNIITFACISMAMTYYMMLLRFKSYVESIKMGFYGENDILTHIKNRNRYERDLLILSDDLPEVITCIYIDADGLHTINNEYGHEEGDLMLQGISNHLKASFNTNNIYRLGGDEFLIILFNNEIDLYETIMKEIQTDLNIHHWHISYGISSASGKYEIETVIKEAEALMYHYKRMYYRKHTGLKQSVRL